MLDLYFHCHWMSKGYEAYKEALRGRETRVGQWLGCDLRTEAVRVVSVFFYLLGAHRWSLTRPWVLLPWCATGDGDKEEGFHELGFRIPTGT